MTAFTVPSDSAGVLEVFQNKAKLAEAVAAFGSPQKFLDAFTEEQAKTKGGQATQGDLRDQVQSVMFDMIRDAGGGRKPAVDLANAVRFQNGRPTLNLSANGTSVLSRGKGTIYNKWSPGAAMENALKEDDRFGTIGEYLQAIREEARPTSAANRKDLLRKLENVRSFQNSFGSEDPGAGGFLIPEIMRSELLQLALEESIVRQRATVIPMSTLRVPIPTVDDTSHVSSLFGGVVFYWTEESASMTESQAKFGKITLDAKKLTGFFKVPNELLADAPAFSGWFDQRIPMGLAWYEDVAFLTETGAGVPQGVIGSPGCALVSRTSNLYADLTNMYARMLPTSLKSGVWVASFDLFPTLAQMQLSTANASPGIWVGGYAASDAAEVPPMTIFGRPVIFTEKVPASGTSGDIGFYDFSYYLIGDRQSVAVAASDQFAFQNDQTAYRLISRVDGRPWVQTPLTPHNGSSSTLSPYVVRN